MSNKTMYQVLHELSKKDENAVTAHIDCIDNLTQMKNDIVKFTGRIKQSGLKIKDLGYPPITKKIIVLVVDIDAYESVRTS